MRTVLVVAYLFPPLGGPGVQRTLSFVRHLPTLGWRPVVLAASDDGPHWALDPSLLAKVPPEAEVHRVEETWLGELVHRGRALVPAAHRRSFDDALFVPDRQVTWLLPALRRGLAVARRQRPALIYATGAPWTNLLVGAALAHRLRCPLVLDYRDPWTDGSVFSPVSAVHQRLHRLLEAQVDRSAAWIFANSPSNELELEQSFPVSIGKTETLPNGWDEEDFSGLSLPARPEGSLVLGYAGNFYAGRPADEVLEPFAAARSLDRSLEPLRLRFFGNTGAGAAAAALGLPGVEDHGYRPLAEALAALAETDATLVTVPAGAKRGWVPQKLYQQLRLGRPVLTLAPDGDAADIARAAGQPVVAPGRPETGAALAAALRAIRDRRVPPPAPLVVAAYDRAEIARRLAETFDRLAL